MGLHAFLPFILTNCFSPGSNVEIYNHYTHNQQPQQQPQQTQLATVPTIANPNFISQLAQQQAFQQILNSQVLQQQHHHHQQQPQQQLNISNRLIEEQLAHAHLQKVTKTCEFRFFFCCEFSLFFKVFVISTHSAFCFSSPRPANQTKHAITKLGSKLIFSKPYSPNSQPTHTGHASVTTWPTGRRRRHHAPSAPSSTSSRTSKFSASKSSATTYTVTPTLATTS